MSLTVGNTPLPRDQRHAVDRQRGRLKINWCELTVADDENNARYDDAFITDRQITAGNVAGQVAPRRARSRIENEINQGLKKRGYHLEHNFGHGKQHLSSLLLTINLLVFARHTFPELGDERDRFICAQMGRGECSGVDHRSALRDQGRADGFYAAGA